MTKYSFEFKKQVVQEHLDGKGGAYRLAKAHGIPHHTIVRRWIAAYEQFGEDGLKPSQKNREYSFEYKLRVVKLYLNTETSYRKLALAEGIKDAEIIRKWVIDYKAAGSDALKPKRKGRKIPLSTVKEFTTNANYEYVKQLEEELLKLKIENAYLKELRRLRLEEEDLQKKQRESFTASEESSD